MYTIYALTDQTDKSGPVYVGMTNNPRRRLIEHTCVAHLSQQTDNRANWLLGVIAAGRKPDFITLDKSESKPDAEEAESFWIASLRFAGLDVVNEKDAARSGTVICAAAAVPRSDVARWRRRGRLRKDNKSGFKGVRLKANSYDSRIVCNGIPLFIGRFKTAEDAARAYDDKARELFGSDATLNFPRAGERGVKER